MRLIDGRFNRAVHIFFLQTRVGPVTRDEIQLGKQNEIPLSMPKVRANELYTNS
jgi:hypothetical protein